MQRVGNPQRAKGVVSVAEDPVFDSLVPIRDKPRLDLYLCDTKALRDKRA
jgi:hypothetical protein